MNQVIQELVAKADEIKKIEKKKADLAERIRELKSALDDDENKFLECEQELARLYQNIKCALPMLFV
jgi:septal ring factor EnvC (AmiA/AmiB activator)